nr:hypothetical protein [Tanacetum cinerariifolium]
FRRSGRLKGKGPVVEENTIEDAIDVDEYVSEDENVSQDEGSEHIIGTQVDNKDVGPSTSGVDILDVDIVKDEEIINNKEDQYGTNKVKPNDVKYMIRKSNVADMNFKLNFIVLFTSIMGGVKTKGYCDLSVLDHININVVRCGTVCNDFKIERKRPPTTRWTSELLKKRELAKIKSEGLRKGELAGPYVEEEDDPMPDNLEYHNEDNERTTGVRTDDSTMTNQRKEPSLETDEDFDTPMMGSDTQLVVFESADKLYEELERNKRIIDLEIPSFSLGLTQEDEMETRLYAAEYEMGPKTHEEVIKLLKNVNTNFMLEKMKTTKRKKLAVYLFSKMVGDVSDVLFETKYGQQSSRGQIESLGPQELVDNNVLSSWSAYLNFLEGKKDKNSPASLFLPTFEVVFIPVSNNEHKFILCVNMKNPAISVIDSKKKVKKVKTRKRKKDEDINDMKVASILHKFFGKYLLAINHGNATEIIEAQLVRGTFDWQTDKRSKDYGIFLMRHRESYIGNELGKWKCGLDDEGKKQNTQLGYLRNKYAAKILLSDCNMYKSKILKAIKVPQRGK